MKTFLIALTLLASTASFATEINLSAGSSAVIRAGDEARVTCQGSGGDHGGSRCRCIVGSSSDHAGIPCSPGQGVGYVVLIGGSPMVKDGCWGNGSDGIIAAGNSCRSKMREYAECR